MLNKLHKLTTTKTLMLAFLYCLHGCQSLHQFFETPNLQVVKLGFAEQRGFVQYVDLTVEIDNTNPYPLNLVSTRYSFQFADLDLISGETNEVLRVPAGGSNTASFKLGLDMLAALDLIRVVTSSGLDALNYELKLELDTGLPVVGIVPIVRQGQVDTMSFFGR